jgi:hypothetical protein
LAGFQTSTEANLFRYALGNPLNVLDPTGLRGLADVTFSVSGGVGKYGGAFSITLTKDGQLDPSLILGSGFGLGASLTADFSGNFAGDPQAPPSCPSAGNTVPPLFFSADFGTGIYGGSFSTIVSPSGVGGGGGVGWGIGAGTAYGFQVF